MTACTEKSDRKIKTQTVKKRIDVIINIIQKYRIMHYSKIAKRIECFHFSFLCNEQNFKIVSLELSIQLPGIYRKHWETTANEFGEGQY